MIIAVDTGGTKTLIARFSDKGTLEDSVKIPTPSDASAYIHAVADHIHTLGNGADAIDAISVALPNIGRESLVKEFSNIPWKNFDIVTELAVHFPDVKILFGNDAKLGGLGESRSLLENVNSSLYVTVSTGIGVGLVVEGSMSQDLLISEAGHMVLEYNGVLSEWEAFASGQAIYKAYGKYGSEISSPKIWQQIADRISRGFLALVPTIQPDVIIIGGSMGIHFQKYNEQLTALLDEKLPSIIKRPSIIQAHHPEQAVIYGCYYHAIDTVAIV